MTVVFVMVHILHRHGLIYWYFLLNAMALYMYNTSSTLMVKNLSPKPNIHLTPEETSVSISAFSQVQETL